MVEDTKEYFFTQILKQTTVLKYFKLFLGLSAKIRIGFQIVYK